VFDGAVDPNAGRLQRYVGQSSGFESTLRSYLAECSTDSDCAFHHDGDAEGAFDQLMGELDAVPLPTVSGRPALTRGMALLAVANALYHQTTWPALSAALAQADQGDGSGLLALFDDYYQRRSDGTWGNELEAFAVIGCMDSTERPTVGQADADSSLFRQAAPRLDPGTTGDYGCTFFPPPQDPRVTITGAGAGPIVVCGATGDAATPLAGSRAMASTLEDGRLIVVVADNHTCYGVSECAATIIDVYLVDLDVPPVETDCG
jgi:hypothetical protein